MKLHPSRVGVHPKNREGKAVMAKAVHENKVKVDTSGFSFAVACPEEAICTEDDEDGSVFEFTSKLFAVSDLFPNASTALEFGRPPERLP